MAKTRADILEALRATFPELPTTPGVYLFKDAKGVVLYVGKAKTLRSRVASYFQPSTNLAATRGPEVKRMIDDLVVDVDVLECESEVDALLRESRLIKDIQPRFNERQKDDKTFPYVQVTTREDFPRVQITRQPDAKGVRLFGPFVSVNDLRAALPLMQRVFKFRTCKLDIDVDDDDRRYFRPCILHNIKQCTAPCGARVSKGDYAEQIRDLISSPRPFTSNGPRRYETSCRLWKASNAEAWPPSTLSPRCSTSIPPKAWSDWLRCCRCRPSPEPSRAWTSPTWTAAKPAGRWWCSSTASPSRPAIVATRSRPSTATTTSPASARWCGGDTTTPA
jgi:hypothetical protein